MGGTNDLVMDLRMNYANLNRDIAGAKGVIRGFAGSMGGLAAPSQRMLAGIGAAVGLAVREFAKANHASEALRSALAANGHEVDNNFKRMSAFAEQVRNSTVYSAAFVEELQAMALNLGVSAQQTDEVVRAGIGLGKVFFGGDAQRGVTAAALAIEGNTRRLMQMIPALRMVKTESAALRIINQKATAGWKEAQRDAATFSGSMNSLSRSYHEAGAAIGQAFAPEVVKLAKVVDAVAVKIRGMDDTQKAALVTQTEFGAGALLATIGLSKIGSVATGLRGVFGRLAPAVGGIGAVLALFGASFVNFFGRGESFGERLADTWAKLKDAAGSAADYVGKKMRGMWDGVIQTYFQVLEQFGGGSAEAMMKDYYKGMEEADKAARKQLKDAQDAADKQKVDATKATVDKTVELHAEGARKIKSSISSIPEAYREVQKAIIAGGSENSNAVVAALAAPNVAGAQSQAPLAKQARAAMSPQEKAVLQENAASQELRRLNTRERALLAERKRISAVDETGQPYTDSSTRSNEIDRELAQTAKQRAAAETSRATAIMSQQKASGENPLTSGMDPMKLASNVADARKRIEGLRAKLENLDTLTGREDLAMSPDRDSIRKQLEIQIRKEESLINRGGRGAESRPFGKDELGTGIQDAKDRKGYDAQGIDAAQRERNLRALMEAARLNPAIRQFVETAKTAGDKALGANQDALGATVTPFGKAATDMQKGAQAYLDSAAKIDQAADKLSKIGVVKD